MLRRGPSETISNEILDEASEWFVEMNEADVAVEVRQQFAQWLRRSQEHVHAYLAVSAVWDDARLLERGSLRNAPTEQDTVRECDVDRLPVHAANEAGPARRFSTRALAIAATVACICVGAASYGWLRMLVGATSYVAEVGEHRSIVLEDGSTMDLNSRTHVRVRYAGDRRSVELIEGQALFHVAKDAARPFVVSSAGTQVRAVGTAFDVYQKHGATVVTVVEGRVDVSDGDKTRRTGAGERVVAANDTVSGPERADVSAATAWMQRKVVFESVPLAEVVDELNRYRTRPLVLSDERLREYHITGVFSSTDPVEFMEFLQRRFDVEIVETQAQVRIERRR